MASGTAPIPLVLLSKATPTLPRSSWQPSSFGVSTSQHPSLRWALDSTGEPLRLLIQDARTQVAHLPVVQSQECALGPVDVSHLYEFFID